MVFSSPHITTMHRQTHIKFSVQCLTAENVPPVLIHWPIKFLLEMIVQTCELFGVRLYAFMKHTAGNNLNDNSTLENTEEHPKLTQTVLIK
jgi:hypothetical protein